MYKLSKEDVLHVSELAKLHISNTDKYRKDLEDILNMIDDIETIDIKSNIMISPSNNENIFSKAEDSNQVDVLLNTKNKAGYFVKLEVEND